MTVTFTEFTCRASGSNMNGGASAANTEQGTSALYTSTNGNWNGTTIFTPTDGSTPASSVTVGDFAHVFVDAATVPAYIARVTAVTAGVNGAITLSAGASAGTPPASSATARSINVGGAWLGPNGAVGFPFGFVTSSLTDATGDPPRINFKNNQTYSITAAITHSSSTSVTFQGYATTFGDGGRFTLDAGTNAIVPLTLSGNRVFFGDFIIQNNGTTGSNSGLALAGGRCVVWRGVVNTVRGNGFNVSGAGTVVVECEAYACNGSNTSTLGGFNSNASDITYVRCIAHDNAGSNGNGFVATAGTFYCYSCIADTNGGIGFFVTTNQLVSLVQCDAYNNTSHGINAGSIPNYIDSCNLVKNGGWGIAAMNSAGVGGWVTNCGFGSGTQANTSGTIQDTGGGVYETGNINYASGVTPWVDPANGDFRVNLAAAINAGRGKFTQTAASYAGAIGYPDIGAVQHLESGGGPAGPIGQLKIFDRGTPY